METEILVSELNTRLFQNRALVLDSELNDILC